VQCRRSDRYATVASIPRTATWVLPGRPECRNLRAPEPRRSPLLLSSCTCAAQGSAHGLRLSFDLGQQRAAAPALGRPAAPTRPKPPAARARARARARAQARARARARARASQTQFIFSSASSSAFLKASSGSSAQAPVPRRSAAATRRGP
jgi:hypothetical protein